MAIYLYTTKIKQVYLGEFLWTTINHFTNNGVEDHASDAVNAYVVANVLPALNAMQNQDVSNVSAYTYNQSTGEDSYFTNLTGGGDRAVSISVDDRAPAFICATFRFGLTGDTYGTNELPIKKGSMHVSGLLEGDFGGNTIEESFASSFLDDLEAAWIAVVNAGVDELVPVVHTNPGGGIGWHVRQINRFQGVRLGTMNTRKTHI